MTIHGIDYKICVQIYNGPDEDADIIGRYLFDSLDELNAFIERTQHLDEYAGATGEYTFVEVRNGIPDENGQYYFDIDTYEPLAEDDFEQSVVSTFYYGPYGEKGYVIRSYDETDGEVYFRGMHNVFSKNKDAINPRDTYNKTGAKKALTALQHRSGEDKFYSIERLSTYYLWTKKEDSADKRELDESIRDALHRLDELWDGNDFHKGDKMRINEIRKILQYIRENL